MAPQRGLLGLMLLGVVSATMAQEAYRCETQTGQVIYQGHACPSAVKSRVIQLPTYTVNEGEGVNAGASEMNPSSFAEQQGALADVLAADRRARGREAKIRDMRQSLERLSKDYHKQRGRIRQEQANLAADPAFRNWESNVTRREKYENKKRLLAKQLDELERDYWQSRARMVSALARAESGG